MTVTASKRLKQRSVYPTARRQMLLAIGLLLVLLVTILLFGIAYWKVGLLAGSGITGPNNKATLADCLYFSVTTISTLGYGDIAPLGGCRLLASTETLFGLLFFGFAISQMMSAKQDALVEYLANERFIQTYDECIAGVVDAKELIADRRRMIQAHLSIELVDFVFNRSNPFYPALRSLQVLNGYSRHVEAAGTIRNLKERIERAANHVEELAGFIRKYINLLDSTDPRWRTKRTKEIAKQLCGEIELFSELLIPYTRYQTEPYKGGGMYSTIVRSLTAQILRKLV